MKLAIFTQPRILADEALLLNLVCSEGADYIHLRKPGAEEDGLRRILDGLSDECLGRIVLHDFHNLCDVYPLKQIQLNSRNPLPPVSYTGNVCRSCHSLEEVAACVDECLYVTLSPIFDSISKQGYTSRFTQEELSSAGLSGRRVVALGGVTPDNVPVLRRLGFSGAAMLGCIWKDYGHYGWRAVAAEMKRARKAVEQQEF